MLCTQPAGWGTPHPGQGACKFHGGSTENHIRKAERERAGAAVVTFGLRRDIGPEEALLEEVQWTAGHVAWLRGQVQELDPEGLTWGLAEERTGGSIDGPVEEGAPLADVLPSRTFKAGEPVIVKLYREERRHLVDVARAAASVGVSERLVRLREREGELLVGMLQRIEARMGFTAELAALWRVVVPQELRAVAAGESGRTFEGEVG